MCVVYGTISFFWKLREAYTAMHALAIHGHSDPPVNYRLHAVVVHSGVAVRVFCFVLNRWWFRYKLIYFFRQHAGHYQAFVRRPEVESETIEPAAWFRLSDTAVTTVPLCVSR